MFGRANLRKLITVFNNNAESLNETQEDMHSTIVLLGKVAHVTRAQNACLWSLFTVLDRQGLLDVVQKDTLQDLLTSFEAQREEISRLATKLSETYMHGEKGHTSPQIIFEK